MAESPKFRYAAMTDMEAQASFLFRVENDDPNTYRLIKAFSDRHGASEAAKALEALGIELHPTGRKSLSGIAALTLIQRQDLYRRVVVDKTEPRHLCHEYKLSSKQVRDFVRRAGPAFLGGVAATLAKGYTAAPLPTHVPPQENPEKPRGLAQNPFDRKTDEAPQEKAAPDPIKDLARLFASRLPPARRKRKLSDEQIGMLLANHATKRASYYQLAEQYDLSTAGVYALIKAFGDLVDPAEYADVELPAEPPEEAAEQDDDPEPPAPPYRTDANGVVNFLRSREMAVLKCGNNAWKLNGGKDIYTADGLVERANEIRLGLGLPIFELVG